MKTKSTILINVHWVLKIIFKIYIYFLFSLYTKSIGTDLYIGLILISLMVDLPVYILGYILAKECDERRKKE